MRQLEGEIRIPSGCAISGIFRKDGSAEDGTRIINSIRLMHDRSNGLGGGFAAYGIYPEYSEWYALHIFYLDPSVRSDVERFLDEHFDLTNSGEIKTRKIPEIRDAPGIWRYFIFPRIQKLSNSELDEAAYTAECVFAINRRFKGKAAVFSSGKNMGVFKANAFPEDVGRFYMLEEYEGYAWTAHGRYPTNTPGWWGGAHPFSLLDYAVVHNGEISSYDANRRNVEMFGYECTLRTDTEVITYIFDYLTRKLKLTIEEASHVVAAPFWSTIETLPKEEREYYGYLRNRFPSLLINGPFSIILGFTGGMLVLGDRLKLRSMVVAEKGEIFYAASEESAIRLIEPDLEYTRAPEAGEPVVVRLNNGGEQ
ncbi:MAG: hypothetical protein LBN97_02555 [Oscillospiraceae bacterium]|jgi:glutamate synthase domain-containing protein 1|nr:hypothetical protein [Oscillospiraceae bacterium]